jgi:hypothetical protein
MSKDDLLGCAGIFMIAFGIIVLTVGLTASIELSPVIRVLSCSPHQDALGNCRQFIHDCTGWYSILRVGSIAAGIVMIFFGWVLAADD